MAEVGASRMNRVQRQWLIIGLLAVTLAGLGTWWFLANFDKVTALSFENPEERRLRNRFDAALLLLQKAGRQVSVVNSVNDLPEKLGAEDTFYLLAPTYSLSAVNLQRLIDWVDDGGHLIYQATGYFQPETGDKSEPLLEHFSVAVKFVYQDDDETEETEAVESRPSPLGDWDDAWIQQLDGKTRHSLCTSGIIADSYCDSEEQDSFDAGLTPVQIDASQSPLIVHFHHYRVLEDVNQQANWVVQGHNGPKLLQIPHGRGYLTVVVDADAWSNDSLLKHDHGASVMALSALDGRSGQVFWQYFLERQSLLSVLWQSAASLLVAVTLLSAFLAWRSGFRFGPARNTVQVDRRSLLEHVQAAGLWQADNGYLVRLVTDARNRLDQEISRRRPAWPILSEQEKVTLLLEHSGLSAERIHLALFEQEAISKRNVTEIAQALQQIQRSIADI